MGCQSAARDIATEAFAKLFRDQGRIENPVGWLKRIGLDHLRSARRRGRRAMGPSSPRTARESPEAARQLSEEPQKSRPPLAEMQTREIEIRLAHGDVASDLEIAMEMRFHPPSVWSMISRALHRCSSKAADAGGACLSGQRKGGAGLGQVMSLQRRRTFWSSTCCARPGSRWLKTSGPG